MARFRWSFALLIFLWNVVINRSYASPPATAETCADSINILVIHGGNATRRAFMDMQFNAWSEASLEINVNTQYDDEPTLDPAAVASDEQRERVQTYCENPGPMLEAAPSTVQLLVGLKHQRVWERLARGDLLSPLLIAEDDVQFDAALPTRLTQVMTELPSDFDVAWLYRNYSALADSPLSPEQSHVYPHSRSEGGHAYLLSRHGAQKFLQRLPMRGVVCLPQDLHLNSVLKDMGSYVFEPTLAEDAGADHSTIWEDASRPTLWSSNGAADQSKTAQESKALIRRGLESEAAKDNAAAADFYRRAAAAPYHNTQAQVNLGVLYHDGRGVRRDAKEAARLWTLASNQGYSQALCNLANLFFTGDGVHKDYAEAVRLFELALVMEKEPSTEALFKLGLMQEHGLGIAARNTSLALEYYEAAARGGNEHAPDLLKALQARVKAGEA